MSDCGEPASFGHLVRQYRLDARLTQAALAERAGISLRAVQDLERSVGRPQRETARRLAEALALTAESRMQFDRAAAPAPRVHPTARSQPARNDVGAGQPERDRGKPEERSGEQKCVTMLIADVAGLTESVHGFEPDLADRVQLSLVPLLVDVIHGCRGTVNRVGGDGIMAIFGAPLAHEDDAVQACVAALALHDAFEAFASRLGADRGLELSLRVGLASSDVVLRSTSNDTHGAYTALGPAVRVATRLVQAAAGGTTLLTAETVRAAEGYIHVKPAGSVAAGVATAGSTAGINAFELLGAQPPRTRFQRVVTTRQLTRFVGRDAELTTLASALGAARAGRGQIVALVGEPGVGKSRLDAIESASDGASGGDSIGELVDTLAHHAVRGQLWDRAVAYLRRAAQRDSARSANRQAARYFEQTLDALNHLPNHRDAWELGVDIRLELRNVLLPLAEFELMFDHLQTAEALAIALDDRARLGWVSAYQAAYYCNFLKPRKAEAAALRALAIADECGELPLQVMAHFFLGLAYVYASRYKETLEPLRWNVSRLRGDLIYERFGEPGLPSIFSRSYLIRALAETGDFDEALTSGDEAVRLAEQTDFPLALANALEGLGYVHLRRGNLREAIVLLERGLQICRQWQVHLSQYVVEAYLGCANALVGRDAEAVELLEQSAAIDSGFHPALRVTMLGEAHLLGGRSDLAQRCVDQALALAAVGEEHGSRAWTLRLVAEVALAHGLERADWAVEQYRVALALATDLGMRPLQAHCHLGLGKLYRRIHRLEDARASLSAAITLLDDLQMALWLPEAEAELAAAGGPLGSRA